MNIKLMKDLDELFGPIACLPLHIYNGIKNVFVKPSLLPIDKILLIKFFGMGSILMTGPMIRALKNKYPAAKITIMTFSENRELCALTGLFDEIVSIDTISIIGILTSAIKNMLYLRKQKFDVCIDLEFFSKFSTIVCYLTGGRIRVGFFLIQTGILLKMMWRGNLLTHQVYHNDHKHVTDVFLALSRCIGADTTDYSYASLRIPEVASNSVDKTLNKFLGQDDKLVVVNINASALCLERRWPKESFVRLLSMLLSDAKKVKVALIGGKEDEAYVKSFLTLLQGKVDGNKIINLTAMLSMAELTALLSKADLLITNDSGPMHIAISLNRPTLSFFGPESPRRFGSKEDKMHAILYSENIYCSPCLNVYNQKTAFCNGNNVCLKSIIAEDAYTVLKKRNAFLF